MEAFSTTPEFMMLYTGLKRLNPQITKGQVLYIVRSGSWETLQLWMQEGMRRAFPEYGEVATPLWIALDSDYLQRQLTDVELIAVLKTLRDPAPTTTAFLKQILCSVRSDEVRKEAALRLYEFAGKAPPEPYQHDQALQTFLPHFFSKEAPISVQKTHRIEDGDSLWKVSRKYKVSIEKLREANQLKTDQLKPGRELIIPAGE